MYTLQQIYDIRQQQLHEDDESHSAEFMYIAEDNVNTSTRNPNVG